MRKLWARFNPWSTAITAYLGAMVLDWLSSLACNSDLTVYEMNPFMRDAAMRFVLRKALIVDAFWFVAFSICAITIYEVLQGWNRSVAKAASAGIFAYFAINRLLTAVIPNTLLAIHFNVPEKASIVDRLLQLLHGRL